VAQQAKGAFTVVIPDADPSKHRSTLATEMLELTTVFVKNQDQAAEVAKQLVEQGCRAIELCGGFGHAATAKVAQAVRGKTAVGAVRFDFHPLLGKSADELS